MSWRFHGVFAVLATVAVVCAIGWGFVLVGSPGARRLARFDEQRLQDLQAISREVYALAVDAKEKPTLKAPLPTSLEELARRARVERIHLNDPETGEPYRYTVKNESTFELCATFTGARDSDRSVFWNHPAGAHCFTINVLDPPPCYLGPIICANLEVLP
jgi:hypothetical protein